MEPKQIYFVKQLQISWLLSREIVVYSKLENEFKIHYFVHLYNVQVQSVWGSLPPRASCKKMLETKAFLLSTAEVYSGSQSRSKFPSLVTAHQFP